MTIIHLTTTLTSTIPSSNPAIPYPDSMFLDYALPLSSVHHQYDSVYLPPPCSGPCQNIQDHNLYKETRLIT